MIIGVPLRVPLKGQGFPLKGSIGIKEGRV